MNRQANRNFHLLAAIAVLGILCAANAKIIYVDDDATGANDGSSWENAYTYLQDALMLASAGDEIRVAQGVYKPDDFVLSDRPSRGREETFQLINGVSLMGGYAGLAQPDPNARDIRAFETILTGDLFLNDPAYEWQDIRTYLEHPDRDDNCYSVVTANGVDRTAVLDGCTITAGHANIYGVYAPWIPGPNQPDPYSPKNTGAGLYINAGSPTLTGCTFHHNTAISYRADTGGAVFNRNAAPTLTDCSFLENWTFSGDAACAGGAIRNIDSNTTLTACTFTRNSAQGFDSEYYGGAIYNSGGGLNLTDCTFTENSADWGGAISNAAGPLTATGCVFTNNRVNDNGGAIIAGGGPVILTTCSFTNNRAYSFGGAICSGSTPGTLIAACTFTANHAREGGAVHSDFREPLTIDNCIFTANSADGGGALDSDGAWYQDPNGFTCVTNCAFTGNRAINGGALQAGWHKKITLTHCLFTGNLAWSRGAVIYASGSVLSLTNCTLAANRAREGDTLAARSDQPSAVEVSNCILFNSGEEISDPTGSTFKINFCDMRGGWPGEGNIDADPCFADPGYWDPNGTPGDANDDIWVTGDYHLKSNGGRYDPTAQTWVYDEVTSPCVDAGNPMTPIGPEPFPNGGLINMGAYGGTSEASKSYFGEPVCETIVAGDINGDCKVDFEDFALMAYHWLEER